MIKDKTVGIEQFDRDKIADNDIQQFISCIKFIPDPEMEAIRKKTPNKLAAKVVVKLKNKNILEKRVDSPKGDPDNPFSWEEIKGKFEHLAVPVYGQIKVNKLCSLIENLEECNDFSKELTHCLED